MSSTKTTKQIPFAIKRSIKEYELKALKDSVNGCLHSSYGSTLTGGIEYCLEIFPNGNRNGNRGKFMVNFGVKLGKYKQIDAKYTILVESANRSKDVAHTFKETEGWGKCFCETVELFDPEKRLIVDKKMVLKVYGIFEIEDDEKENAVKTALTGKLGTKLWENDEGKDFKLAVDGKELKVHQFILGTVSPVFAEMFKSKKETEMKIDDFSFYVIDIAMKNVYDRNFEFDTDEIMSVAQFGDKYDIHFLKDRCIKILFRCHGKPFKDDKVTKCEKKRGGGVNMGLNPTSTLGDKLWANNDYKDFKIIVEGKELIVHQLVLAVMSPKFAEMLKSKEASENGQFEISDFSYNIVETALKMMYDKSYGPAYKNFDEEKMALLQFFEKYNVSSLKENLEKVLIGQLSISNVCLLLNCSIASNAAKLKEKCLDFLKIAVAAKISIADIIIIDKEINSNILQNPLYHTLETQRK